MPRRVGYLAEWSKQRRKDPAYRKKQAEWYRAWYERNKNNPDYLKKQAERMRRYTKDVFLRERHMARWMTNHRIQSGTIKRMPCEICGALEAEAHHDDYTKPLEIRWLCTKHHREFHAKAQS